MPSATPPPASKRAYKSLQYFLNRSAVLAQYRQFLRTTLPLAPDTRSDVRKQIRDGFEAYRDVDDDTHVGRLLRQSKEQLKMVSDLVDTATAPQRTAAAVAARAAAHTGAGASSSVKVALESMVHHSSNSNSSNLSGTWTDAAGDDPDDVKGRIGTGWPWKSSKPMKKLELEGIKRRYGTQSFLDEQ